ncbi:hypothetical protein NMY22_g20075 [Coprinellus aureogranulatus]|nr:hypothetical protein NMY22_g20075 [Coprinellus aureogranulatus]
MPSGSSAPPAASTSRRPGSSTSGGTRSDEKVRMEYENAVPVNRPMAIVNSDSESQGPVTMVHHEDSGIRMMQDPRGVPTVLDVPPEYTPQ